MATSALIQLESVTKTYGGGRGVSFEALKGVDLSIEAGEFVAIMGASGSGKSTLMNILGCLDVPSAGRYLFGGRAVEGLSKEQRALIRRHYLGFVFQGFNLLARTSALENVELPLLYRGLSRKERRAKARRALDAVGLLPWEDHSSNELSGGQQQRVAVARAMASDPQVLFADEPTGNLDSKVSREVIGLITRLNQTRGITVVMVTHEPEMAAYARRVITVRDGLIESDRRNAPRAAVQEVA
ncbi:MAG: ABC transporter ATP-binding protein [Acidobacteriota bacterium]